MIRRWMSSLAIVATLSASAAAAATARAPGAGDPDLRCMLVASALSQNADPKARTMGGVMVLYYLGHLDARKPGIDLHAALEGLARVTTPAQLQEAAPECVATVSARGRLLQSMSNGGGRPPGGAPGATAPAPPTAPPAPAPK